MQSIGRKGSHDVRLLGSAESAVRCEGRHQFLMAKVLTAGFHRLYRAAGFLAKLGERLSKRVRMEVWQTRGQKCSLEYFPDRPGIGPMTAIEAHRTELTVIAHSDQGCWEQRVVKDSVTYMS
jgi:hypothetical protein